MYDHGANLRAQAGALEELLFSHSDEITQLVDVFLESGIYAGGMWHYKDDALCEFYGSDEYSRWLRRSREPNPTDEQRKDIAAEYEQIMDASVRRYVEEVIDPLLTRDIDEDAA